MSLLCWSKCKQRILERSSLIRSHKFTRVSMDVQHHLDGVVRGAIDAVIRGQPGKGVTIAMGTHKRGGKNEEVE